MLLAVSVAVGGAGVLFEEPTMAAVQEREMERVGASVSLHGRRGAPVTELTPLER